MVRFYENGKHVYSQELEGGEANKFSNIIIGQNRNRDRKYIGSIDDVYITIEQLMMQRLLAFLLVDLRIQTEMASPMTMKAANLDIKQLRAHLPGMRL